MLVHKRLFSTTPAALAKRRQIAIQRKKANVARQVVLKAERSPANFDPIVGVPTAFTRSILTPNAVWSADSQVRGSLHFDESELSSIQSAVERATHDRIKAEPAVFKSFFTPLVDSPEKPSTTTTTSNDSTSGSPAPVNSLAASEEDLMTQQLSSMSLLNAKKSASSARIMSLQNANARTLRAFNTAHAIREFGRAPGDTGSAEVQAAILTVRILAESQHIANNKKDVHGFRGFRGLVHQRQKILKYLRTESVERYLRCIERLGLDDRHWRKKKEEKYAGGER